VLFGIRTTESLRFCIYSPQLTFETTHTNNIARLFTCAYIPQIFMIPLLVPEGSPQDQCDVLDDRVKHGTTNGGGGDEGTNSSSGGVVSGVHSDLAPLLSEDRDEDQELEEGSVNIQMRDIGTMNQA
jgi:hypothetical protein